ncbi:MAG TPA: type II toxin-antitoxin system RelE/ParE family toxin [Segetibacter sp.]
MAYQIIVKKRFTNKIVRLLEYLETEWGKTVADNFLKEIDRRLHTLSEQPLMELQVMTIKLSEAS